MFCSILIFFIISCILLYFYNLYESKDLLKRKLTSILAAALLTILFTIILVRMKIGNTLNNIQNLPTIIAEVLNNWISKI